jgi:hypothetical protein
MRKIFSLIIIIFPAVIYGQSIGPTFFSNNKFANSSDYRKAEELSAAKNQYSNDSAKAIITTNTMKLVKEQLQVINKSLDAMQKSKTIVYNELQQAEKAEKVLNDSLSKIAPDTLKVKRGKSGEYLWNSKNQLVTKEIKQKVSDISLSHANALKIYLNTKSSYSDLFANEKELMAKKESLMMDSLNTIQDSISIANKTARSKTISDSLDNLKNSNIDTSRFVFFGEAALGSGSNVLSSITSSGSINFFGRPFGNWSFSLAANLLYANSSTIKKDSVDFTSLMFPETGHFGLLASVSYDFKLKDKDSSDKGSEQTLSPIVEFAYRKVSIDSPAIGFKVLNYNFGIRYQWAYKSQNAAKDEGKVTIMPYINLLSIPMEDVKNFTTFIQSRDSLFSSVNKKAQIFSFGIKATLQYKSFVFFADYRKNLNTSGFTDSDPLKGTAFNIGFATSFKLLSF